MRVDLYRHTALPIFGIFSSSGLHTTENLENQDTETSDGEK
jgi:hypothetical protein